MYCSKAMSPVSTRGWKDHVRSPDGMLFHRFKVFGRLVPFATHVTVGPQHLHVYMTCFSDVSAAMCCRPTRGFASKHKLLAKARSLQVCKTISGFATLHWSVLSQRPLATLGCEFPTGILGCEFPTKRHG